MATIDPITGLPSSNVQTVYAGDKPINQSFQTPAVVTPASSVATNANFSQIATPTTPLPSFVPPTVVPDTSKVAGIVAGTQENINQQAQTDTENLQEQKTQDAITQQIINNLGFGGTAGIDERKAIDQAALMQAEDVSGKKATVKNLLAQIAANKVNGVIGGTVSNAGFTQGQYDSQIESKNLMLGAQLLVAQGQYDSAKEAVTDAITMKYAPEEARNNALLKYAEINKEALGKKADQIKELATARIKDSEKRQIEEKDVAKLIIDASAVAPADVLNKAKAIQAKGGSTMEVAQALGIYGGDYLAREKIKAEIRKMDADSAKTRADAKATTQSNSTGLVGSASSNAKAWLDQYNSGAMSLEDIYTKIGSTKEAGILKNQVAQLVAAQGGKRVYGTDDATVQAINAQIQNINDLLYGKGATAKDIATQEKNKQTKGDVGTVVGLVQGGLGISPDSLNVYKQDALATAKNLVSNQTLQALADAKSKGITFGALSEGELGLVSDAASRISSKLKIDPVTKEITGFTGSESQFKEDLKTIKDNLQKSIITKTQTQPQNQSKVDNTADDIMIANKTVQKQISGTYNIFDK